MPVVPRQELQQVEERQGPNVRAQDFSTLESFGGGAVAEAPMKAAGSMLDTAAKVMIEQQREADRTRVNELTAQAQLEIQNTLHAPETGLLYRKGKDALGAQDDFNKSYTKLRDNILKEASNERQKGALTRWLDDKYADYSGTILKHSGVEFEKEKEKVFETKLATVRNEATLNFMDPEIVAKSIAEQHAAIEDQYKNRTDKDGVLLQDRAKLEASSATHFSVIKRMLGQGNDIAARKYYESLQGNDKALTAETKEKLDPMIREHSKLGESLRLSDEIMKKSGSNMTRALEMARNSHEDDEIKKATVEAVKSRFADINAADEFRRKQSFKRAANIVEKAKDINEVMRQMPEEWANFTVAERNSLKAYGQEDLVSPHSSDYFRLRNIAINNPKEFTGIAIETYKGKIARSEIEQLLDIQSSISNKNNKHEKQLDDWRTEESIVSGALNKMGIDPTPKPGTDASTQVTKFRSEVAKRVKLEQERTGKPATNEDYERIVNSLSVEVVTKRGWFWDTKKKAFELDGAQVDVDSIPNDVRSEIETGLRKRGLPVTPENIQQAYMRGLGL
jgi:hypothetical protein